MGKQAMTFRLCPQVAAYLRSRGKQAETIENAVRRSYGFRSWIKAMEAENGKASVESKVSRIRLGDDRRTSGNSDRRKRRKR